MHYLRLKSVTSTAEAKKNLVELISKPECVEAYFVRTLSSDDGSAGEADFISTNFPLVVGFLTFSLSKALGDIRIVFDGFHVTGVRAPRAMALESVLRAAVVGGNAFVSDAQIGFTSSLSPEDAHIILSAAKYRPMTETSLDQDLRLLSSGYTSKE